MVSWLVLWSLSCNLSLSSSKITKSGFIRIFIFFSTDCVGERRSVLTSLARGHANYLRHKHVALHLPPQSTPISSRLPIGFLLRDYFCMAIWWTIAGRISTLDTCQRAARYSCIDMYLSCSPKIRCLLHV